jgi:hypothetical protein
MKRGIETAPFPDDGYQGSGCELCEGDAVTQVNVKGEEGEKEKKKS